MGDFPFSGLAYWAFAEDLSNLLARLGLPEWFLGRAMVAGGTGAAYLLFRRLTVRAFAHRLTVHEGEPTDGAREHPTRKLPPAASAAK